MTIRYAPPTRRLAVAVVLLALTAAGAAGKPLPLGPEISISHPGYCPGLAGRTDGTFAVAWPGFLPPDRITMSVRGGRLGGSLGSASVVAVEAAGLTGDTEAAATAAGYTVVWQAVREDRSSPHFALATDRAGMPRVEPRDLDRQSLGISPRPAGGFVAHWPIVFGNAVFVQLLDAAGREIRPRVRQPAHTAVWTGVAHRSNGDFVLYWNEQRATNPNRNGGVYGRRFDALGRPMGTVFILAPRGGGPLTPDLFRLAVGPDGTMAAAWAFRPADGEAGRQGIQARMFDRTGSPLGRAHELMGAPARAGLWFVPGGPAVDAERRALVTGSRVEGNVLRARALALAAGALDGQPFDLAQNTVPSTFCPEAAAVGNSWLVAWYATTTGETFIRPFSR